MSIRISRLLPVSMFALALAGCSFGTVVDAEKDIQRTRNDAADLRQTAVQPLPRADVSPVRVHEGVWLGSTAKRRQNGETLPRAYEREGVTLISATPLDLKGIADFITDELGISTYLDPDIFAQNSGSPRQQEQATAPPAEGGMMMGIPPIEGFPPNILADVGPIPVDIFSPSSDMRVNHKGKLSDFLNRVAAKFDVAWEYKGGDIRFFRNVTRTFLVKALPSTSTMGMNINSDNGGSGSGDGGSSSSSMSSSTELTINMWEELQTGFKEVVGDNGRISVSPSTGTVTISAPPSTMERLSRFIRIQNERFSKQVAISVRVLNVSLSDSDQYGLSISGLLSNQTGDESLLLGAGEGISDITSGMTLGWTIFGGPDNGDGASGVINALSQRGDVSVVTSASATTLNNIPTPLQVGTTRDYVSEVGVERDGEVTTVEISTDTVNVGFNMQLLPRVVNDGRLLLQYNISQSELAGAHDGFDIFEWENQRVQLANINSRSFSQQVEIPNGATLVLSGFEQSRSAVSKRGTGTPDNMLLGGSQAGSMEREIMVILISPVILDAGKVIVEL